MCVAREMRIGSAVSVGTVLIIAILFEVVIRFAAPQPYNPYLFDPLIGERRIPGSSTLKMVGGVSVRKRVNSAGFVDDGWTTNKQDGVTRIALLGDSFVEAQEVRSDEDFETLLEPMLGAEVLNFGIAGHSTAQEYLTLKKYASAYSPDVVVVAAFLVNDVADNSPELGLRWKPFVTFNGEDETILPPKNLSQGFPSSWFRPYLHSYRWVVGEFFSFKSNLKSALRSLSGAATPPLVRDSRKVTSLAMFDYAQQKRDIWESAWRTTGELFARMRDEASRAGADFLVVLIPSVEQVDDQAFKAKYANQPFFTANGDYNPTLSNERAAEMFGRLGISYLDLYGSIRELVQDGEILYVPGDGHLNERGHRVVAEILADYLRTAAP